MDYEKVGTAYQSNEEFKKANDSLYQKNFKSGLKIFSDHNGFISGELHTFVGTKGSGKSTWSKTILSDLCYSERGVLLYISEERKDKYVNGLNSAFRMMKNSDDSVKRYLDNIIVIGELDDDIKTPKTFFESIRTLVKTCELEIVLIDNFTTSFLSELPVSQQSAVLRGIKALADELNVPILVFFHTAKLTDPKRLDGDNIRGSATAINIGSYNYLINQHKSPKGEIRNFVYTEKARYHSKANKSMYEVKYNADVGLFTGCDKITMESYIKAMTPEKKAPGAFG